MKLQFEMVLNFVIWNVTYNDDKKLKLSEIHFIWLYMTYLFFSYLSAIIFLDERENRKTKPS